MKTEQITEWTEAHQSRDGASWDGWDGSLLFRLGVAPAAPDVRTLANSADSLNADASAAPVGAVHFFDVAPHGHAGVDVDGGGARILTTGRRGDVVGDGLVTESVAAISERHKYLGWTLFG